MPGFTAYMGLLDIGQPQPGGTVVGIADGPEKYRYVVEELGFHACLDHRAENLKQQLAAACPQSIDVSDRLASSPAPSSPSESACKASSSSTTTATGTPSSLPKWAPGSTKAK